jgi:hypothetical protein
VSAERPAGCPSPATAVAHALARRRAAKPERLRTGRQVPRPAKMRDADYVVPPHAAGDDLIALLADEIDPTVVQRRYSNGDTGLLTSFEM